MQRSALCRSRLELSNAYLLAKFGFDTAENEPFFATNVDDTFAHLILDPAIRRRLEAGPAVRGVLALYRELDGIGKL